MSLTKTTERILHRGKMTSAAVAPTNLPKRMSRPQLEWWILFGICVAGKSAKGTEKKVQAFMEYPYTNMGSNKPMSPFERVRFMIRNKKLLIALKHVKMGKYALFNKGFRAAVNIDLDNPEKARFQGAAKKCVAATPHFSRSCSICKTHQLEIQLEEQT